MTDKLIYPATAAAALLLSACATTNNMSSEPIGTAMIMSSTGAQLGTATLLENGNSLSVSVEVAGLPPGSHGFHLHTTGRCEAPDFQSAGGHLNPANKSHGIYSPNGAHLGDLPNLQVSDNGTAAQTFSLVGNNVNSEAAIFDADGTAVMIHAGADDYRTDPAGDAGSRIACGVLRRP
ncbi:superoxide dismutase family protein [Qipengyuania atrilutea]|uniref:Superoxide dismutase family protein n=1 Tax=Qipengyuania atrilutea TaxID=2744473 RepID=A0A850H274_9SPHN|nr:superoxide dismutase family protein [Actirhodobacter atriluteus]NVD44660.1 superoxide dismutase family protein [Actirhodobacter atriluteus]